MRIGLDARFYGPHAGTGIGRYTNRLIEQLERLDGTNEYVVFLRDENFAYYQPSSPRFSKVRAPWRWYSFGEQSGFPRLLRQHRLDLTHYLNFNVPLAAPSPFVVTIHDLILSKFPTERASTLEPVFYWLKHAAYNLVIRAAVHRSARIVAVTDSTKRDLVASFRVPPDKATVISEACDAAQRLPLVAPAELARQYGLTGPFLLYVGTAYPHKNLERLVEAFAQLRSEGVRCQLVLVGRTDYFYDRLRQLVAERRYNPTGHDIILTGYVNDDLLDALYRQATVCVCPALYEGFGLPGLEAMAHGTPVLAARTSSLPEVYADAAEYVDPLDVRSMVDGLRRLMADPVRRSEFVTRGHQRVATFSWERMARETLAVYTAVGGEQRS